MEEDSVLKPNQKGGEAIVLDEEAFQKLDTENKKLKEKLKGLQKTNRYLAKWKKQYEDAEYIKEGVQGG